MEFSRINADDLPTACLKVGPRHEQQERAEDPAANPGKARNEAALCARHDRRHQDGCGKDHHGKGYGRRLSGLPYRCVLHAG